MSRLGRRREKTISIREFASRTAKRKGRPPVGPTVNNSSRYGFAVVLTTASRGPSGVAAIVTAAASSSVWTVDLLTGTQRQLTPWRDGLYYGASSFSPDGSTLLATHEDNSLLYEAEPVALELDGSGSRRLLEDGFSPVYSPDGSEIALVRHTAELGDDLGERTDLYVIRADGSGVRRLTRTPGRYEFSPSWDPSGERLAYVWFSLVRTETGVSGTSSALMQINADGTCRTKVPSPPGASLSAPAWQPGRGRGAGRIEC